MDPAPPGDQPTGIRSIAACGVLAVLLLLLAAVGHFLLMFLVLD